MEGGITRTLPGRGSFAAQRLLPVTVILIEALWIFPWMAGISKWNAVSWEDPPLGLGSTLLFFVVAYFSAGYALHGARGRLGQIGALAGTVLLLAFLLRVEQSGGFALWDTGWGSHGLDNIQKLIAGFFFGTYIMWRGHSLSQDTITPQRVYRTFLFGLFALAFLLVVWDGARKTGAFTPVDISAGVYIAAFFFSALAALALSNFHVMQMEAQRLGVDAQGLHRRWVSLTVTVALVIVLVGLGIASVLSLRFSTRLKGPLDAVGDAFLAVLLYGIILPVSYIAGGFIWVGMWLFNLIRGDVTPPEFDPPGADGFLNNLRETADKEDGGISQALIQAGIWSLVAVVVTIVLIILIRLYLRRRPPGDDSDSDEVSESLWSWERFVRDLWLFILGLFGGLGRRFFREPERPVEARFRVDDDRTLHIREMYQGLLWEGRVSGRPKQRGETPSEYATRLRREMPGAASDVEEITDEYIIARYGHRTQDEEGVPMLNRVWRRLRSAFRGEEAL